MRILVLGGGGREHALCWSLARSSQAVDLFAAPGNPGTAQHATNVSSEVLLDVADTAAVVRFAKENEIDLAIVGPERPLVEGVADDLRAAGVGVVGPSAQAARLEGSKAFAKAFMQEHAIPTARHRTFPADEADAARRHLAEQGAPVVVKASGLAAGKGAFVCRTEEEAEDALKQIAEERRFGEAGDEIVIEEYMEGEEVSVFALTDGHDYALLAPAQDHKRLGDGGTGPNTGGMGAYAPAPVLSDVQMRCVEEEIIVPTLEGMAEAGAPYRGVLYCGLMLTDEGPKVVEYNCRLGDPEAQVVLPLLSGDAVEVFHKLATGRLGRLPLHTFGGAAACVVLASGGYPTDYETGFPIEGVEETEAEDDVAVFHAGTARDADGQLVTAGGRVLGVTALGETLDAALDKAYHAADRIQFEGKTYRRDIGRTGREA